MQSERLSARDTVLPKLLFVYFTQVLVLHGWVCERGLVDALGASQCNEILCPIVSTISENANKHKLSFCI